MGGVDLFIKNQSIVQVINFKTFLNDPKLQNFIKPPYGIYFTENFFNHPEFKCHSRTNYSRGKSQSIGSFSENMVVDCLTAGIQDGKGTVQVLGDSFSLDSFCT